MDSSVKALKGIIRAPRRPVSVEEMNEVMEDQAMSTEATLAHHHAEAGEPSWHLFGEVFEAGVVYLEPRGVSVELQTRELRGADVVLRLPIETAKQLGLHTTVPSERWESACASDKLESLEPLRGSVHRYDDPTDPVWRDHD
jgi:hypothetical protein